MPLRIKNRETHELACRLAALTGDSLTGAVTIALRERLARVEAGDPLAGDLLAIGRDCAHRLKRPCRTLDHGEMLYDERGLPR